jgi:D-sedoheptulose 7-phosphate isomerase
MSDREKQITAGIQKHFSVSATLLARTGELYSTLIFEVAARIAEVLKSGGKVLTCGNGGSASDAEHIAAEFVGRFRRERRPLPAIALTSNSATLTSIGNDYGFEQIFARQVMAHGSAGDILIAISTSGKSPNVLAALQAAKAAGVFTVGLAGERNQGLAELADAVFAVPSSVTAEIQQCHIAIAHAICETIDELLSDSA